MPTLVDALLLRRLNPGTLSITDELQLHVGHHAENGDNQAAEIFRSRNFGLKHAKRRTLAIQLMHQVQHVAGGAPEPVQAMYDQFVTFPQEFQDVLQFGAASLEAPEPVSVRMTSQPAALSLAFWISRSWDDELTRAYPILGMALVT